MRIACLSRAVALAVVLASAACGGEGNQPVTDETRPPPIPCMPANVIDLDAPGVAAEMDGVLTYAGTIDGPYGNLKPSAECSTGGTSAEKVHKITPKARSRVRASARIDVENVQGSYAVDPVVYIQAICGGTSSQNELGCGGGGVGARGTASLAAARDVAAGDTVYIVVDGLVADGIEYVYPQPYILDVAFDPVVLRGEACDPSLVENVCESGTVCSVANGSPRCTDSAGGPTLSNVEAIVQENRVSLFVRFAGRDPDGDVVSTNLTFLDDAGKGIDFNGDGAPDVFHFAPVDPLPGVVDFATEIRVRARTEETIASIRAVTFSVVDSSDVESEVVTVDVVRPAYGGPGATCSLPATACSGELICQSGSCAPPAATTAACSAVDAAAGVTAPGTYTVHISDGATDTFQGSCWTWPGYAEAVRKITIGGTKHVRFTATTEVAPTIGTATMAHNTYLYLRRDCDDPTSELACNDDLGDAAANEDFYFASGIVMADLEPGDYYLFVDGSVDGNGFLTTGDIGLRIDWVELKDEGAACTPGTDFCLTGQVCRDPADGGNATCQTIARHLDDECAAAPVLVPGTPVQGRIAHAQASLVDGSCRYLEDVSFGEQFHKLVLTQRSMVTASTASAATDVDTLIYFLDACTPSAQELACNDDVGEADWRSSVSRVLDPGTYWIVVDLSTLSAPLGNTTGAKAPDPATYELVVTVTPQ